MANRVALITGATGQDGAYLAELLLDKGYTVHGIKRRSSSFNTARVDHLYEDPHGSGVRFFLHYGDMTDSTNLIRIIQEVQPTEIYNLAAQSHVRVSFETPVSAGDKIPHWSGRVFRLRRNDNPAAIAFCSNRQRARDEERGAI